MRYIEASLVPGETVVYHTRLHWTVMLRHFLLGLLLLAGSGALLSYLFNHPGLSNTNEHLTEGGAAALLVCGIAAIIAGMVRRNATEMAVTNRRVMVKQGLVNRKTIEMLLNKVETIEVSEPMAGRMLGYGSITIVGTGGTSEPFHKIAHPLQFRGAVLQQLERLSAAPASSANSAEPMPPERVR
ncbi:MAG TPA: PH domain-containing protein [Steroidobacteraceae bacterium]|nr:PH domain-containing protein [Steroidobacteraceae bacterium]